MLFRSTVNPHRCKSAQQEQEEQQEQQSKK
jgi:hypothetical protein